MSGTKFSIEVQPRIPPQLKRLEEFANDLVYSWDRQIRALFLRLDRELWERCGHNPKIFLRRVDQRKLEEAGEDPAFLQDYARVCSTYDAYLARGIQKDIADFFTSTPSNWEVGDEIIIAGNVLAGDVLHSFRAVPRPVRDTLDGIEAAVTAAGSKATVESVVDSAEEAWDYRKLN